MRKCEFVWQTLLRLQPSVKDGELAWTQAQASCVCACVAVGRVPSLPPGGPPVATILSPRRGRCRAQPTPLLRPASAPRWFSVGGGHETSGRPFVRRMRGHHVLSLSSLERCLVGKVADDMLATPCPRGVLSQHLLPMRGTAGAGARERPTRRWSGAQVALGRPAPGRRTSDAQLERCSSVGMEMHRRSAERERKFAPFCADHALETTRVRIGRSKEELMFPCS